MVRVMSSPSLAGLPAHPVAMSANAAAPAMATAVVRREVLTVTPLCAWIGDDPWERSQAMVMGALPRNRAHLIHERERMSTRVSACFRNSLIRGGKILGSAPTNGGQASAALTISRASA